MDLPMLLSDEDLARMMNERVAKYAYLSALYDGFICGLPVDLEEVGRVFREYHQLHLNLYRDALARKVDHFSQSVVESAEVALWVKSMHEGQVQSPPVQQVINHKFPEVKEWDPASYAKFRLMLNTSEEFQSASDLNKLFTILGSLPPSLAMDIDGLTYTQALAKLDAVFGSEAMIRTAFHDALASLPPVKGRYDVNRIKALYKAIDAIIGILKSADPPLQYEAFRLAIRKLPRELGEHFLWTSGDSTASLSELSKYLKKLFFIALWFGADTVRPTTNRNGDSLSTSKN